MKYQNFQLASYVYAYYLDRATPEKIREDLAFFQKYVKLTKVYLETHRALVDVPEEKMLAAKKIFEDAGIEVAGGITTTIMVGEKKPSVYDTFCYSDPRHRAALDRIVRYTAKLFDEFILDDFFFGACKCKMCIEKKGRKSWAQFKLDQMEEVSRELVAAAKEVNPACQVTIKYPNWYESYQETGYNPGKQKDIFDRIYTGTESRNSNYSSQHLQRYMSYSLIRLMENIAPGRNGGGWIDMGGAMSNMNVYLEQAELTFFAKAKELMMFNFPSMVNNPALAALGVDLERVDRIVGKLGNPVGVSAYEPYDSDGEDQLINYVGMLGIPLEPVPYFDDKAPVVFLTQNSAYAPDVMEKFEKYVREGGIGIVTSGFFRAMADRGIFDMTSVRPTDRKMTGTRYQLTNQNVSTHNVHRADEPVTFTALNYKTNATWTDVLLHVNDFSTPVMTEDYYGDGFLYILNIPDNFGDLYKLPKDVVGAIAKNFARKGKLFLSVPPKCNLFLYDNDTFGIFSYSEFKEPAEIVLLGDDVEGFEDLETGMKITKPVRINPGPMRWGDTAAVRPEPVEKVFNLPLFGGGCRFFRLIKKDAEK
ncbi:MAG: hypothetical protein J5849_06990 [Clostridia bacterium]|nr:hypothetical protein [Clostridia bacterium]